MSHKIHLSTAAGIIIPALCIALLISVSCKRQEKGPLIQANPAFREYVEAFTSGLVSTRSTVRIRMNEDFVDSSSVGLPLAIELISLKPSVNGVLIWTDSRTLEFRPETPFDQDKLFTVQFYLSKLVTVPDSLSTMTFQFRTMKQDFDVTIDHHNAENPTDLTREMITGTLFTADAAADSAVELMLSASQEGKNLPVSWQHDGTDNKHIYQVQSVERSNRSSSVKLKFEGNPIGSRTKKELSEVVFPLDVFSFTGIKNIAGGDPYFVLTFTDPLKKEQNLEGLVRIGKVRGLHVSSQENELFVYPPANSDNEFPLTVEPYLRNNQGKMLGKKIMLKLNPAENKPSVRFVGTGNIMPSSNGMLLPFEAVNLKAVDVKIVRIYQRNILQFLQTNEMDDANDLSRVGKLVLKKTIPLNGASDYGHWNRYSIDLSTVMKSEPGAIYSVSLRYKKEYSVYPCDTSRTSGLNDMIVIRSTESGDDHSEWNYYSDYDNYEEELGGWRKYRWEERDDPCKISYYFNKKATRNVFASNLGIIVKGGGGNEFVVFITNLLSAKPLKDVKVSLYSYQQQPLVTGTTDADGMVRLTSRSRPFFAVAEKGSEKGYLKLSEGSSLSLSMFDVSGEPIQKGLKGFICGERGVWRPGDSIFLTLILQDKSAKLPSNHPVSLALTDPSGALVTRQVLNSPLNGFYVFRFSTSPSAPTGNWLATVKAGGAEFRKTLKIETVKPNRLKIKMDFGKAYLQKNKIPPVTLEASWLTGAKAGNLKAQVSLTLTKSVTAFKQYPGYIFDNPMAGFAAENINIFDGKLDAEGKVTITPSIHVTNVAPGALNASFETRVFEDGGDFSIDRFTIPYYPYLSYAGIRVPQPSSGDRVLYTGKAYTIDLVNVDADGNAIASGRLKAELFKLEWRWWWDDSESGSSDFVSTSNLKPVDSATIRISGGKGSYTMNVANDDWGRYLIRVTDRSSGHVTGKIVYVDWPGYYRMPGGEKQAASMLTITTGKQKYKVGEMVKITIPTSPDGRALLTVENGSAVLKSFWTPTVKGSTDLRFTVTPEMSPNCYAFVTLIQPHAQSINDLPVRLYGVLPVYVEDPSTHLKPVVSLNGKLSPMQQASVSVKEANGNPMTYTLAIVDEGLLDLTRFKTPDPWGAFYAKEALGVKTWDLFDQVMGAYSGDLQRILSIGGDQDVLHRGSLKANRFKPMVKFFGPFVLKKGETKTTTFRMPEYIGSVRIMVVAGNKEAYGRDELTAPVKKALMVQGTLPRILSPGESVALPVSVFAMEKTVRNVKVTLETNEQFEVNDGTSRNLVFDDVGDQLVTFDLKTREMTGIAKVRIIAVSGKERAESNIEIDVRNPDLPVTDVYDKEITGGGSWNFAFPVRGMKGTNSGSLELSAFPALGLEKWMSYLIRYPYGCIEQTVSSVFPQLYIKELAETDKGVGAAAEQYIREAIRKIRSFQLPAGGFGYWPGPGYADDWATSYAGHFLMEAEKKGYALPPGLIQSWKSFQREKALSWAVNASYNNNDLSQAYRLFTLALARVPEIGAMNRLLEKKGLSLLARWRLAGAYLLAGKPEVAKQLVNGIGVSVPAYSELAGTYGSSLRDKAIILEVMTMLNMRTRAAPLARDIAGELCSKGWYSTQTAAYCLVALSLYHGVGSSSGVRASFSIDGGETTEIQTEKQISVSLIDPNPGSKQNLKVINNSKGNLYARLLITGIPVSGDSSSAENGLKMSVTYTTLKGAPLNPSTLQQGTSFLIEVKVTNTGLRGPYTNVALTQVFPSGWEISNSRMSEATSALTKASEYTYQDVRDDRVNTFFDIAQQESKIFKVLLTATYRGRFRMPSVQCEAMYDNSINARVPGRWVVVSK